MQPAARMRCNDLVFCYHNLRVIRRSKDEALAREHDPSIPWACVAAVEAQNEGELTDDAEY